MSIETSPKTVNQPRECHRVAAVRGVICIYPQPRVVSQSDRAADLVDPGPPTVQRAAASARCPGRARPALRLECFVAQRSAEPTALSGNGNPSDPLPAVFQSTVVGETRVSGCQTGKPPGR